ncbi:MAG: hypothetical protein R3C45_11965 [Phycisphaerales bacterium]
MKNSQKFTQQIAFAAGSALALAIGSTSVFGTVVISDGFGDADRNNDGVVDRFDLDISANGTVDTYEAPLYPGSSINEANVAEDPRRRHRLVRHAVGPAAPARSAVSTTPSSTHGSSTMPPGATPSGTNIDSGSALSLNSKGRSASVAGFFGQNVALGPNIGDQVKVSFDMRLPDSPNLNSDSTPGDEKAIRAGVFPGHRQSAWHRQPLRWRARREYRHPDPGSMG